jgi:hypothetical protein
MSPYEIAPSENARIPVKLQFFLTDDFHVEKVKKKVVQTQTDELKGDGKVSVVTRKAKDKNGVDRVEYIPEQLYIPKKTGIDAFTQVENDELFNFDREVEPIIQVLITKTIEQSLLELEEDMELHNMQVFKKEFTERILAKNTQEWTEIVDVEVDKIFKLNNDKSLLLGVQAQQERLAKKVASQHIAHNYLRDLEKATLHSLEARGRYRDQPQDVSRSNFMDYITKEVFDFLKEEIMIEEEAKELFPDIETKIMKKREKADKQNETRRKAVKDVTKYKGDQVRSLFVYWENEHSIRPTVFSCFHGLVLDGTYEVVKSNRRATLPLWCQNTKRSSQDLKEELSERKSLTIS